MTLPGVDVSSFQGLPDSWRVAAGAIRWAAVKFSEVGPQGTYVNPDAKPDWDWLKQQGHGRIAYLFAHPGSSVPATADAFVSQLRAAGLEDGDGVAVDVEITEGLGPAEVDRWSLDVMRELDAQLDRVPLLYSFISFIEDGNCASLGGFPLWLADPSAPEGHPVIPAPWKACAIQQYSITGAIDRDVAFYPDVAAMRAALGKRKPPLPKMVHWRAVGIWSLAREAREHKTTPEEMIALAKAAGWHYRPAMVRYIEKGDWEARLPPDVELFAPAR